MRENMEEILVYILMFVIAISIAILSINIATLFFINTNIYYTSVILINSFLITTAIMIIRKGELKDERHNKTSTRMSNRDRKRM